MLISKAIVNILRTKELKYGITLVLPVISTFLKWPKIQDGHQILQMLREITQNDKVRRYKLFFLTKYT